MRRHLSVLFVLAFVLAAPVAFGQACWVCRPVTCPDPEMWWECADCDIAHQGEGGALGPCAMYPDGGCSTGYQWCMGSGSLKFNATWQVASIRVTTPGAVPSPLDTSTTVLALKRDQKPIRRH